MFIQKPLTFLDELGEDLCMELTPNKLVLLLKIRRVYMLDSFLKNGFKSRNELGSHVENNFNPSKTVRDFIVELMDCEVLFIAGSLKLNIELCDRIIKDSKDYLLVKQFIAEHYNMFGKSFFE